MTTTTPRPAAARERPHESSDVSSEPAGDLDRLTDPELVARCLAAGQGFDLAFEALYARHADRVFGFLLKLTRGREAAEDALQETFVRVYKSLDRFDPRRDLAVWLLQIARYVAIDAYRVERKVKRLEEAVGGEVRPPPDPTPDDAEARERQRLVQAVLDGLDMDDRALLLMRHHAGLTFQAVGDAIDCSARTAQNRVEAAARRFQQALTQRRAGASERRVTGATERGAGVPHDVPPVTRSERAAEDPEEAP